MCDEHEHEAAPPHIRGRFSRRRVLQGALALAALTGCSAPGEARTVPLGRGAVTPDGLTARVMAMHLHASASEGGGSARSQLTQAALNGFDVAWFTEHDFRRHRELYRTSYSFTADESQVGGIWNVPRMGTLGSAVSGSGGTLVSTPVSTSDPAARKGSLRMRVTSTGTAAATVRNRIDAGSSRQNFRGRIAGRTLLVDVLPVRSGVDAWSAVLLRLSHTPALGGAPAGIRTLLYRLRTDITAVARSTTGLQGVVDLPVRSGRWQTVTLDPLTDVAALWPGVRPEDNSLGEIEFHAVSRRRAAAEHLFGYLRFVEQSGYDPVGVETAMLEHYRSAVPDVLGLTGTEISLGPHINQYGGPQDRYDYGSPPGLGTALGDIRADVVRHIHGLGGLASINHPFEPEGPPLTAAQLAANLIGTGLDGADILEVGYAQRGTNGTLAAHLAAWDAVSRNGLFVTGNGVSDDHSGQNWARQKNRYYTGAWTTEVSEQPLLDALAVGRCYVGYLGGFTGSIDMGLGPAPMGSVLVGSTATRTLSVDVRGLHPGAAVQVLRGDVDYAGAGSPTPNTQVVQTLGASDVEGGWSSEVGTDGDCFYRVQVVDGSGTVLAFGQPTWALTELREQTGDPKDRLVRD